MKIIFVIQQLLRTCQSDRLCGSTDGVKSIDTSVNLFFTRSRLLSYTTHFARGYRLVVATALLLTISISASFAQDAVGDYRSVGSGDWDVVGTWARYDGSAWINSPAEGWPGQNAVTGAVTILSGMNVNINSLSTKTLGIVTIDGTLTINTNQNPILNTPRLIVTSLIGKIVFAKDAKITLPPNAALYVTTGGLLSGTCNNNNEIIIGTITYSYCVGGGKDHVTFKDVEDQGGTGIVRSNSPICLGGSINLWASPPPLVYGIITYAWSGPGVWTSTSQNNTLIASATTSNNDIYTVVITGSNSAGNPVTVTRTLSVTVTPPGTIYFTPTTSSRNQGAETITYTAIATSTTTATTYSLSPASAAETFNTSTGELKYSSLWNGTCVITATATGCNGTITATHTVSTNWCYALFTVNGALSCAGASSIDGHIGTLVGATTGFTPPLSTPPGYSGPGILSPSSRLDIEASTNSVQAAAQVVTAYNDLAAMPCSGDPPLGITLAADKTFTPKVYCTVGALTINTTIKITLDGLGDPNSIFIFKVNGALTTETLSKIELTGLADYRNVYWQVAGAVVLSGDEFIGTIINNGAISLNTGAKLNGRALSISGAIALTTNTVTSNCYPLISVPNNSIPTFVPPGDLTACVENLTSAVYNPVTIDINLRPDYYTFSHGDERLNLGPTSFIDDKSLVGCYQIRWKIDMNDGTHIPDLAPFYNTGQPSESGDIKFLGDGIGNASGFSDVKHTITYWIVDCENNESLPQTRTITIKPRPYIIKLN